MSLLGLFSSCGKQGPLSSCGARASRCSRLSCCGAQPPGHAGSATVAPRLCRHSALSRMWDPPRSGIEPVSSALAGGFFTTEPPGNPGHISSTASSCCRVFQSVDLPHFIHLLPELPTTSHPHKEVCSDCLPPSLPYGPCANLLQILLRV